MNHVNELIKRNTIIKTVTGSVLYGLNKDESDVDEMGVFIEDLGQSIGFRPLEHYKQEGTDYIAYSLRKFLRLALKGNPTVLELFFVPNEMCEILTFTGRDLQSLVPRILSKQAGRAHLGYLQQQKERLDGTRGQMNVNRQKLIERYGFDTKYAMHMIRLAYQGIELLETGKMTFPLPQPQREFLMHVRDGHFSKETCLSTCNQLEEKLKGLCVTSKLADYPETDSVDMWMTETYWNIWKGRYT